MNCFNHNELSAIGICKHCNKGICQNCLSDTGNGLTCKGHCTKEVIAINKLIEYNKKVVKGTSGNWKSSAILFIAMGCLFILTTVLYFGKFDPFFSLMGTIFLVYGFYVLQKGRSYKEDPRDF